jgi:o-succinylbenzoate synthase
MDPLSWQRAALVAFALRLEQPIDTARGPIRERRGWLLRLFDDDGHEGHATAMPIEGFGGETFEACGATLGAALSAFARGDAAAPLEVADDAAAPFAASAWHAAHLDLEARRLDVPLAEHLVGEAPAPRDRVPVNGLVWGGDPDTLRARVRALRDHAVLKLKVGPDVDAALAQVRAASAALAPGQRLRIDPNASWSETEAARALEALAGLPIEYVEQPVADRPALARLCARGGVAVAADESASTAEGLATVVETRGADAIVLKPMCIGGPRRALELASKAQAAGLGVAFTSLLDSVVGVRCALAVALALPTAPAACGLATSGLFERDVAAPAPTVRGGVLLAGSGSGLATHIDEDALRALALGAAREWIRP